MIAVGGDRNQGSLYPDENLGDCSWVLPVSNTSRLSKKPIPGGSSVRLVQRVTVRDCSEVRQLSAEGSHDREVQPVRSMCASIDSWPSE